MNTDEGTSGSVLNARSLDDDAYRDGKIRAIAEVLRGFMQPTTVGDAEAHSGILARAREDVRNHFGEEDRESLAGAEEIIALLEQRIAPR